MDGGSRAQSQTQRSLSASAADPRDLSIGQRAVVLFVELLFIITVNGSVIFDSLRGKVQMNVSGMPSALLQRCRHSILVQSHL